MTPAARLCALAIAGSVLVGSSFANAAPETLASESRREEFVAGGTAGLCAVMGIGPVAAQTLGLCGQLRLGTVATSRLLFVLLFDVASYRKRMEPVVPLASETHIVNMQLSATLGVQVFLRESLWLQWATGIATTTRRELAEPEWWNAAWAQSGGIGYDIFHRGSFALAAEFHGVLAVHSTSSALAQGMLSLGVTWY